MSDPIIRIAVVGHTNTGKTSLLRTLSRDSGFGEVSDTPATTRQVEGMALLVHGQPRIELFDTPGLEAATEVIETLEAAGGPRHTGPERIEHFIAHHPAHLEQEARVLAQVSDSDVVIYVVDAREPVLGKYQDELAVLALCARPVLPVLNFVATGANRAGEWKAALARVNLHAVAAFDTVVFDLESELKLWERLRALADQFDSVFNALITQRREEADWRARAAATCAAAFLIDVAAYQRRIPRDNPALKSAVQQTMRRQIAERERACVDELLALYRFGPDDYENHAPALEQGPWQIDPFDAEALKHFGAKAGQTTAVGAAAGVAFDVLSHGLSLGAGTVIGTSVGAGVGGVRGFGRQLKNHLQGYEAQTASDATVWLLGLRQQHLLAALQHRGHAAQQPIAAEAAENTDWKRDRLPAPLRRARLNPQWSAFNSEDHKPSPVDKDAAIADLADRLTGYNSP